MTTRRSTAKTIALVTGGSEVTAEPGRQMPRRLGTLAVTLAVGFGTLLAIAAPAGAARAPASPTLVDVGGYRLYLRCTGRGSPTVVMDASLGTDSSTWSHVEPLPARHAGLRLRPRRQRSQRRRSVPPHEPDAGRRAENVAAQR